MHKIAFTVLGDPTPNDSLAVVRALLDGGATFLELGFPFSDPTADGPVIQAANQRALESGMSTRRAFDLLATIRSFTNVPIGLLVYAQLVYAYGIEAFCRAAAKVGVQTILIPDLPVGSSGCALFLESCQRTGVKPVFMVSERTPSERLARMLDVNPAFLYLVTTPGVTGVRDQFSDQLVPTFHRLKAQTAIPIYVGFGIQRREQVQALAEAGADGVIVGSAFVKKIAEGGIENLSSVVSRIFR